jgi:hypothetical protein
MQRLEDLRSRMMVVDNQTIYSPVWCDLRTMRASRALAQQVVSISCSWR